MNRVHRFLLRLIRSNLILHWRQSAHEQRAGLVAYSSSEDSYDSDMGSVATISDRAATPAFGDFPENPYELSVGRSVENVRELERWDAAQAVSDSNILERELMGITDALARVTCLGFLL